MSHIQPVKDLPNESLHETAKQKKLKETCREFEAVMVSLVLKEGLRGAKEMNESAEEDGEDSGTKTFKDFAYEQMSYCIGKTGMMGLGDSLYESMKNRLANEPQPVDKAGVSGQELLKNPRGRNIK